MIERGATTTRREWNDYSVVNSPFEGSNRLRQYVERFDTLSFFNQYAGLLSYFYILGQICAPYIRIPIHGAYIDCRLHVFWIQASRSGKSIAYEFTAKILKLCGIENEKFSAGSDSKLIGSVIEVPKVDEDGKKTGGVDFEVIPGLLNGYKTLLFDEGSILLDDSKAYFSQKILFLQQAMAPIGSETNVLVNHLKGASIYTPSGISLWATTFPPKDIMHHVLEKGFFQRVFLYQNDINLETRQTTSEHRMSGVYVPVPEQVWSYEEISNWIMGIRDEIKGRLFDVAGIDQEQWDSMSEDDREKITVEHSHMLFSIGPNYHAALLSAVDDYYDLVKTVSDENVRETAISFLPNVENYTIIFGNMIAATMGSSVITAEHIAMASEIIYDNLHNLIIWLEQKRDYKASRQRQADVRAWKQAFNGCRKQVHDRTKKEVVRKTELQSKYAAFNAVSEKTAERRLGKLIESKLVIMVKEGRNVFVSLEV
tara:strand:+ start:5169 stop:6617 length:1449 start_codon:yes stop_codon:yes gene_type:complete